MESLEPDRVITTAETTLLRIAETMNGAEWNAETLDTIAAVLRAAGFTLEDCNNE